MEGDCLRLDRRLAEVIQQGVFRSYLTNVADGEIFRLLEENPQANGPEYIPRDRFQRMLERAMGKHFYTPCTISLPTIARISILRNRKPPSVVEPFIATAVLYDGAQAACARVASSNQFWTDCYPVEPRVLAEILLTTHWCCCGMVGAVVLPAVSYIARVAVARGVRVSMPSDPPPGGLAPFGPSWSVFISARRHVRPNALRSDYREHASCLQSFSSWIVERPLVLTGPRCRFASSVIYCLMVTLTLRRAALCNVSPGLPCPTDWLGGARDFRGAVSRSDVASPPSGADTRTPGPGGDTSSISSSTERA